MANKRNLKKNIKYICGDVAGDCLFSECFIDAEPQKLSQIIVDVANLQEDTITKVSFSFDKTKKDFATKNEYKEARRKYFRLAYNTLRKQFYDNLGEIVKEMNAITAKK